MTSSSPAGSPPTPDATPTVSQVLRYFSGSVELIAGRPEGLRKLDLSADGFWTSFFAMIVALPPAALSWIAEESLPRLPGAAEHGPIATYAAHALADLTAWLLPVLILMVLARPLNVGGKLVPLVVASNWGGALLYWCVAPYCLLVTALGDTDIVSSLGLVVTVALIVSTTRLLSTAIGRDLTLAAAVVTLMLVCGLLASEAISELTGIMV